MKNLPLRDLAKGTIINSAKRLESLARKSGWQVRRPKKLTALDFVMGMLAATLGGERSFRQIATSVGMLLDRKNVGGSGTRAGGYDTISKPALWKRTGPTAVAFLKAVLAEMIAAHLGGTSHRLPTLPGVRRIIVEDSTQLNLHPSLAARFPAASNQHDKEGAGLKLQAAIDLLTGEPVRLDLTPWRRNDKSAAHDIITKLQPGDLLLRDLGYHGAPALAATVTAGAHYLSRHIAASIVRPRDGAAVGARLDMLEHLREHAPDPGDTIDIDAAVGGAERGAKQLHTRLVARRVPRAVEEKRLRRVGQEEKRRGRKYSKRHRALQGWEIYITSLSREDVGAETLLALYPLRWRIEIIFKACKSHSAIGEIAAHRSNGDHVKAMLYAWLIGMVLATRTGAFALAVGVGHGLRANCLSLLKTVRKIFGMLGKLVEVGGSLAGEYMDRWRVQMAYHDEYEKRNGSTNMAIKLEEALGFNLPESAQIAVPAEKSLPLS